MWPPAHAAIGYLGYSLYSRSAGRQPSSGGSIVVVFGSVFPDLVDKPLAWGLGVVPGGRSLAHSLLVAIPVCLLAVAVAARLQQLAYGIAFTIGYILHLPADVLATLLVRGEINAGFLLWPVSPLSPETGGWLRRDVSDGSILPELFGSVVITYGALEMLLVGCALAQYRLDGYPGLSRSRWKTQFEHS